MNDERRENTAPASAPREFCTLFDSNYLIKAVAMYRSLERVASPFRLTAFCFDEEAERILARMNLEHLDIVPLRELEAHDPALLSTKGDRTPVEYCWTATPALPRFMLETRPALDEITYLDADLLFFDSPEGLFEEMGEDSVLITPHRFSPEYARHVESGIYNVQFMTFRRDPRGLEALHWWHDRCIEWCYYRLEDGKLGDQKYLDDWPERFEGVHVLQHKGGGLAPWNCSQYAIVKRRGQIWVDDTPLVFFHYHRVRMRDGGRHDWHPPGYKVPKTAARLLYGPYLRALDAALAEIRAIEPGFSAGLDPAMPLAAHLRERWEGGKHKVAVAAPALVYVRHPSRVLAALRGKAG
jgi:hypothetical protein